MMARQSATTANTSSDTTCRRRTSPFCRCAEVSVPITHTAVITKITTTVGATIAVFSVRPSRPTVSSPNRTAVSASEPTTSTPVIAIVQPPIRPNHGPSARVTHGNVVPQSWSAWFR